MLKPSGIGQKYMWERTGLVKHVEKKNRIEMVKGSVGKKELVSVWRSKRD